MQTKTSTTIGFCENRKNVEEKMEILKKNNKNY